MKEILISGIDRENIEDFINEFDSYVILSKNVKYAKLLMDTTNKIKNIKCAVEYKERRIKNKIHNVESNMILISNNENDFRIYKHKIIV